MLEIALEFNLIVKSIVDLQNNVYTEVSMFDNTTTVTIVSQETGEKSEIKFYNYLEYSEFEKIKIKISDICTKLYLGCKDNYKLMKQSSIFI